MLTSMNTGKNNFQGEVLEKYFLHHTLSTFHNDFSKIFLVHIGIGASCSLGVTNYTTALILFICVCEILDNNSNFRIMEYPMSVKGLSRMIESTSWPCMGSPKNPTMCLRVLSKGSLSSPRLGAMFTSLGSPFQCPPTLQVKNFFLISILTLP